MLTQQDVYDAVADVEDRAAGYPSDTAAAFFDAVITDLEMARDNAMADFGIEGVWDLPELPYD